MWVTKLCLVFPTITFGLSQDTLNFSINYFKDRNVQFVCLISCENVMWDVKFAKVASDHSIAVSKIYDKFSENNIKQCVQQSVNIIGVFINAKCENARLVFEYASQNMWLDSTHTWLIVHETEDLVNYKNLSVPTKYGNHENYPPILEILDTLNISVNADITLALRNDNQFILYDIFNFGKIQGGDLIITEIGSCTRENKTLVSQLNGFKYYKRWNFGRTSLRMISVVASSSKDFNPILLTEIREVPGISTISRTSTMILMVVAEIHNITFVHTITDRWLGTYDSNATRVVASALYFREQDLTSVLRLQKQVLEKISIIYPALTSLETRYYYRIPTTGPGRFENQFLRPLSTGVWCCVLAISVLCGIILMMAAKLELRPSSAQYALFSVSASICQQFFEDDVQISRVSGARKLTIFITGLSCVLIYNYYTSSVVSWLLNGPPPSINSLQELLESPLELIYQDVGYTRSWLNTPGWYFNRRNAKVEDSLRQKVLNKKKDTPVIKPLEEGIAMVKAGGYAYHTETSCADNLISQTFDQIELCELGSLSSMEKTLLYPGVQKNSPYKEFLTWSLTRLLERGIVSCVQQRTARRPAPCEGSSPRALALGGAAPAFILLAFGYLFATCIMIFERFIFKMQQYSNK